MIIVRFFIGIKSAFGWDSGRIKSFIKTQKKYLTIPTETQRLLNNLKTEGLMGKTSYPIEIKIPHEKTVIDLLKRKVAVFIIGGKLKIKKWPLKNWVNLANLIGEDYEIIIIGGPSEIEEAKYIKSRTKNSYNFCNKFSISDSLAIPLREARENFEKEYLTTQIKKFGGNISKTAKFVGMERSALHRKLKLLGVKDLN